MPENDKRKMAEVERANVELTESLARCQTLLKECRSQLNAMSSKGASAKRHSA